MRVLLIVYDNDSYIHWFPQSQGYLASAIRDAGHEVEIYNQDVYHWPESHLTDYLINNRFDVVGLGFVAGYYPYKKMLKISEAINRVPNRPYYVLGGHGPSPEPEYFLRKSGADVVVIGEGEITIVNLLDALEHKRDLSTVKGIAYLSGQLVVTERQELIQDIDAIPFPAWDLVPMDYYALTRLGVFTRNDQRVIPILSGRGCQFHCNFCYRMNEGCRIRSAESIIEEIQVLKKDYHITLPQFQDELLMTSAERTVELCEAFIKADIGVEWGCNGRLNFAKPEVLKIMKRAGCVFINYGIESVDDDALRAMNKALTVDQIIKGIEATLAEGIHPGFNIIWGNIGETKEVLQKDVDFLLKYDNHGQMRTIRPVTPYPGTALYDYAIGSGLLKDCADFYENKHINQDVVSVNFTDLTDGEFNEALFEANKVLLKNYYKHQLDDTVEVARKLYMERDVSFRGYRQS